MAKKRGNITQHKNFNRPCILGCKETCVTTELNLRNLETDKYNLKSVFSLLIIFLKNVKKKLKEQLQHFSKAKNLLSNVKKKTEVVIPYLDLTMDRHMKNPT